jgi:hypothetical protein
MAMWKKVAIVIVAWPRQSWSKAYNSRRYGCQRAGTVYIYLARAFTPERVIADDTPDNSRCRAMFD